MLADAEEKRVATIAIEVTQKQHDCEQDLLLAEPALEAAQEALNTLNKANLTELKTFGTPPLAVSNVTAAVCVLLSPQGSQTALQNLRLIFSILIIMNENRTAEFSMKC